MQLLIEFCDTKLLIGKLTWRDEYRSFSNSDRLLARPRKSATRILSSLFLSKVEIFKKNRSFPSSLLNATFGVERVVYNMNSPHKCFSINEMDSSQAIAVENACNENDPIVVIQGPPGTGKTHVLERVLRTLCGEGKRILMTAPSNAAVDNVCRRILDLPVLRLGRDQSSISPDILNSCWIERIDAVNRFKDKRQGSGSVYCGTHVGIILNQLVSADLDKNGQFDVIIFDEVGMTRMHEFLLCASFAQRAVLFGDHQQLPPFPLPDIVLEKLRESGPILDRHWCSIKRSALEWILTVRPDSPSPITTVVSMSES